MPLSPKLLIAAANSFYRLGDESELVPGRTVEVMLSEVGQPPNTPWDVAFIYHVGYWSHYDNIGKYSSWPLPATASARDLGKFAEERRVLVKEPQEGDLFLQHSPTAKTYAHAGIVLETLHKGLLPNGREYIRCVTIQGDTNRIGNPRGRLTYRIKRDLCVDAGDRFVRWVDLDNRAAFTNIGAQIDIVAGRPVLRRAA